MSEGALPKFNIPTTPTPVSGPTDVWTQYFGDEGEQQYIFNDIRMRHLAVLQQDGIPFYWLKRRLHGTVCPFWSDESGQCRDPLNAKTTCYNAKYIGGYESPLEIKIALPTTFRQDVRIEGGLIKAAETRPWTVWAPTVSNRDLLVNIQTGDRFEAVGVEGSGQWRGLIMAQFFTMRPLQLGVDYAMRVSVTASLRDIILISPDRTLVGILDLDSNGNLAIKPLKGNFFGTSYAVPNMPPPSSAVEVQSLDGTKSAIVGLDNFGNLAITPLNYTPS